MLQAAAPVKRARYKVWFCGHSPSKLAYDRSEVLWTMLTGAPTLPFRWSTSLEKKHISLAFLGQRTRLPGTKTTRVSNLIKVTMVVGLDNYSN